MMISSPRAPQPRDFVFGFTLISILIAVNNSNSASWPPRRSIRRNLGVNSALRRRTGVDSAGRGRTHAQRRCEVKAPLEDVCNSHRLLETHAIQCVFNQSLFSNGLNALREQWRKMIVQPVSIKPDPYFWILTPLTTHRAHLSVKL